jgi:DNA-binding CsgD family transcriptional regulator
MNKVTFIIAEPSYIIRNGWINIINDIPETAVLRVVSDYEELKVCLAKMKPDILILNAKLLEYSHLDIRLSFPDLRNMKFVICVGSKRTNESFQYFDEKISIDESKEEIIDKLQNLVSSKLPDKHKSENNELSEREKEVVKWVAMGKTNKEIADLLFISTHTAITHRKNITGKLGIKTVSGLTVYAILNGIIDIDEAV